MNKSTRSIWILACAWALLGASGTHGTDVSRADFQRPESVPHPADNAWSEERHVLGKTLFFDPRLSRSEIMSCATCHNPGFDYADGLARGVGEGMRSLDRRTPTLLNLAWAPALFWDGRAETLEEQALLPVVSPVEMNLPLEEMVTRIQGIEGYKELFESAYPNEEIDAETIARAIAVYERTLVSTNAPFDDFVKGDDDAIDERARRGFALFSTKAQCVECHSGWRFTDDSFHDIGVAGTDKGRGAHIPLDSVQFAFKTPTLRNVTRRGPFMHDGSVETLRDVLDLYDEGGHVKRPSLSPLIQPLSLTEDEKLDLLAFLSTLTSPPSPEHTPQLPR